MKRIQKLFLSAVAVFLCTTIAIGSGEYRFDTWSTDNGLPQNGVRSITQTADGYLWFTTFDGLVRFDGVRFTTFNKSNTKGIINNRFTFIFADNDGAIYATTTEDGVLTICRNGEFTSLNSDQVPGHFIQKIVRTEDGLRFLAEDSDRKGRSWYRLSGSDFEFIEKETPVTSDLWIDGKNGVKWKLTTAGVTEVRNGISTFTQADLSKVNFRMDVWPDNDGGLWLGENKVFYIRNGHAQVFGAKDGLPASTFYHSFWGEPDGSVWFASGGSATEGVGLIQYSDGKLQFWGQDQGLLASSIQQVFHDREGNTWLATPRGIGRRRKNVIRSYSTQDGLDYNEIYPLLRDRSGLIWIGSSKGLNIYENGKFRKLDLRATPAEHPGDVIWKNGQMSVQSLWEDKDGTMWVGLNGGIFLVKNGVAERLLTGSHVHAIKDDGEGNVWAATSKGLVKFRDRRMVRQYNTADGLPNEFMITIFRDSKGKMWFGGYGGLSRLENDRFVNLNKESGLAGNYVRTIYEDKEGTMWIGTYDEGLSRLRDGKLTSYREEHGLFSSGVFAIEEDDRGMFWISSNRGIYRVRRQELEDFADGKVAKINSVGYGKSDGMFSNECNGGRQPASLRDDQGRFWFPTQDGVSIVDPNLEIENPLSPIVAIEEITVERQPQTAQGAMTIEPGKRDLEIRYTGISLIKSDQVKFQYKLEGHDKDWIDAGTRRTAFYSYLPPGNYKFLVRASNSDGVWSDQPAEMAIVLKPYFYQTYAFYALAIGAVGLTLFGLWRLSIYRHRKRERKLESLVEERTAELALANQNLEALANSDGLTKIGNRRRFESFLADEWHRAVRFRTEISLVMIDIDHFKEFNDTYGHQAGDECLQRVAEALAAAIKRPTDLVARFGGEEFAIVLGGTDSEGAKLIAEEAIENIRELEVPHVTSGASKFLTVSVGIATIRGKQEASEIDLIRAADRMLYQAKQNGRNRIFINDGYVISSLQENILSEEILDV